MTLDDPIGKAMQWVENPEKASLSTWTSAQAHGTGMLGGGEAGGEARCFLGQNGPCRGQTLGCLDTRGGSLGLEVAWGQ